MAFLQSDGNKPDTNVRLNVISTGLQIASPHRVDRESE